MIIAKKNEINCQPYPIELKTFEVQDSSLTLSLYGSRDCNDAAFVDIHIDQDPQAPIIEVMTNENNNSTTFIMKRYMDQYKDIRVGNLPFVLIHNQESFTRIEHLLKPGAKSDCGEQLRKIATYIETTLASTINEPWFDSFFQFQAETLGTILVFISKYFPKSYESYLNLKAAKENSSTNLPQFVPNYQE